MDTEAFLDANLQVAEHADKVDAMLADLLLREADGTAHDYRSIARILHYKHRNAAKALPYYKRAHKALTDNIETERADIVPYLKRLANLLHDIGNAFGDIGYTTGKVAVLTEACSIKSAMYGATSAEAIGASRSLANGYGGVGNYEKKLEILETLVPLVEADGMDWCFIMRAVGTALYELRRFQEALAYLDKALICVMKVRGPEDIEYAKTMDTIGKVFCMAAADSFAAAENVYRDRLADTHDLTSAAKAMKEKCAALYPFPESRDVDIPTFEEAMAHM
jgi:tetratricopeptide (TPR) repeat protein